MSTTTKPEVPFFFFPRPQIFGDWTVPLVLTLGAEVAPAPAPRPREGQR